MDDPFAHLIPSQGIPTQGSDQDNPFAHLIPDQSLGQSLVAGAKRFIPEIQEQLASWKGMPLDQAVQRARGDLAASTGFDKSQPGTSLYPWQADPGVDVQAAKDIASGKTWSEAKKSIAQYPVEAAQTAASFFVPLGPEAEVARAGEAIPAAAETVVPKAAERAAQMKKTAGAEMEAAKTETPPVPAEQVKPLVDNINKGIAPTYNPLTHGSTTWIKNKLEDLLPPKGEKPGGAIPTISPAKRQALIEKAKAVGIDLPEAKPTPPPSGKTVSLKSFHDIQMALKDALSSQHANERMSAVKIKDAIDDFVENEMGSQGWTASKRRYAAASLALEMKGLVGRSEYRTTQLSSGNRAAAIATEFRNWARDLPNGKPNKNMRMLRGLNPDAADKVERFAKGKDTLDQVLKVLGTAAPSNLMNVGFAEIVGHLLKGMLGGYGPEAIMLGGAAARWWRGARSVATVDDIINTLLEGDKIEGFDKLVGGGAVSEKLSANPATRQAVVNWSKAKGDAKRVAARTLAVTIAKTANTPTLVPRIENELNGLDNQ